MTLINLKKDLKRLADVDKAKFLAGFFKTGKGQYAEGDIFLGITVPQQRKIAKKYRDLKLDIIKNLLESKIHEERLVGLLILVERFRNSDAKERSKIFNFYLDNLAGVNNWDLVDLSAPNIVGSYLIDKKGERDLLLKLAVSDNLWEKRISIVATYTFIRKSEFSQTIKIAGILLHNKHDLIHKAVGWMLREVGKKDQKVLEEFLLKYRMQMPRTMLRYAIERLDEEKRKFYLKK